MSLSLVFELVLANVEDSRDRNACSLVCRDARVAERQTRQRLRLRCTKRQIELLPNCFTAIKHLDLSYVLPKQGNFEFSASQLTHLGECFPEVETLIFFCDGVNDWAKSGEPPFLGIWSRLKEIAVKFPEERNRNDDILDPSAAPLLSICPHFGKPLVFALTAEPSALRLRLKELHLQFLSEEELQRLAQMDLSQTETLRFGFSFIDPLALLREVLSPAKLPVVQTLELWYADDCTEEDDEEDPTTRCTGARLGELLSCIPPVRSLSITICEESLISSIPLCPALAVSLRHLEIDLSELLWMDQPAFDFSPISSCRGLESLSLNLGRVHVSDTSVKLDICSIANKCSRLKSLALRSLGDVRRDEGTRFLECLALEASPTLVDIKLLFRVYTHAASVKVLSTPFKPFSQSLRSLACHLSTLVGTKSLFRGWDCLEHLTLRWDPCSSEGGSNTKIKIACPSLKSFTFVFSSRVKLEFKGSHEHLTKVVLKRSRRKDDNPHEAIYGKAMVQQLVKLAETIKSLGSVTSLSVEGNFEGDFDEDEYLDPQLTEALASITSLRVLKLGAKSTKRLHFEPLLACPSLVEVDLEAGLANSLLDAYEELYSHKVPSEVSSEVSGHPYCMLGPSFKDTLNEGLSSFSCWAEGVP